MPVVIPAQLNIADTFLDARIAEGRGDSVALHCPDGQWTYARVRALADGYATALVEAGVKPEQRVLLSLADGADYVAVLGVSDDQGLTKPHAFVVVGGGGDPALAEELKQYVKDRLEPYKYPREVHFLDVLPRTHLGKVDRGKLRRS